MAQGDIPVYIVGNLTDDPELRYTPNGHAVANFTVASTPRVFDKATNEWKDGNATFLRCSIWRQAAENVAESLTRGARVMVHGSLRQRSYETKEGEKRTVYEVEVDEIGASLRWATARVQKATRGGAATGGRGAAADDPWAASPNPFGGGSGGGSFGGGQPSGGDDPWASAPASSPASSGGWSDEPPF